MLHPSRTLRQTPATSSLRFEEVRFSPGADGQPQLTGWFIPAENPSAPAALLLHGGSGNMGDALSLARALHNAQLHVLLFDYRGFGQSHGAHPTHTLMVEDAESAFDFLRDARQVKVSAIIPVGEGLGASLAVGLAAAHREIPAVVLSSPAGDLEEQARLATRSHLVPFDLLFHERFPLADELHHLATPKLVLGDDEDRPSVLAERAASPKMTVEGVQHDPEKLEGSLRRFLDSYVPR